jgi:arylsulfatase A-like enzyme
VAVRTANAKLIQYPGHEEWTELFDLAKDPYETNNLANDPKQKELLKQMKAEFDRQVQVTEFRIPDYADQPGSTNKAPASQKLRKAKRSASDSD